MVTLSAVISWTTARLYNEMNAHGQTTTNVSQVKEKLLQIKHLLLEQVEAFDLQHLILEHFYRHQPNFSEF